MLSLAYSQSTLLRDLLTKIDADRSVILATPIPPQTEIRLRWEAMISRVFWSLALEDNPLTKSDVTKLLSVYPIRSIIPKTKTKISPEEEQVLCYKEALDYIKRQWSVTPDLVTPKTITLLGTISCRAKVQEDELKIKQFLDYLQGQQDHPVIQAGILLIQLELSGLFSVGNSRIASLASYLVFYKFGYDMRELLVLSDYFKRTRVEFDEVAHHTKSTENVTRWLEYFATAVQTAQNHILQDISNTRFRTELPPRFWELNERQKTILQLLDQPGTTFTNRQGQKLFKISQITASRDLAKLAQLGLIFAHGKGRSVYYSKI